MCVHTELNSLTRFMLKKLLMHKPQHICKTLRCQQDYNQYFKQKYNTTQYQLKHAEIRRSTLTFVPMHEFKLKRNSCISTECWESNSFFARCAFWGWDGNKGRGMTAISEKGYIEKIIPFNIKMVIVRKLLFASETNLVTKQPCDNYVK